MATKKSKEEKVSAAYPNVEGADNRHGGTPGQSGYQDPETYIGQGAKAE